MRVPICLVLLGATAFVVPAHAKLPPSKQGQAQIAQFNAIDTNMTGGISVRELDSLGKVRGANALFSLLAGPDGRISISRVARWGSPALVARLRSYDVNRDGYVTRKEFPNYVDPTLVAALDSNHDDQLSLAEVNPSFAGGHARAPHPKAPAQVRTAKRTPHPQPWCWVPGPGHAPWLGNRHWFVTVPVVQSPDCRTD